MAGKRVFAGCQEWFNPLGFFWKTSIILPPRLIFVSPSHLRPMRRYGSSAFGQCCKRRAKEIRPHRLGWPRTPGFHPGNRGSNPLGDAKYDSFDTAACISLKIGEIAVVRKEFPSKYISPGKSNCWNRCFRLSSEFAHRLAILARKNLQ